MKDMLFILADLWIIVSCLYHGWKAIQKYRNYLLGIEMLVVGVSGTNFLLWSLLSGSEESLMYKAAYLLDAFSRSFGATVLLILGMMVVTHRFRPGLIFDMAAFLVTIIAAFFLRGFHGEDLYTNDLAYGVAIFYIAMNAITTLYLTIVVKQLWTANYKLRSLGTAFITALAAYVAIIYDFFPFSFDDENRTLFYTLALATWGTQAFVYYHAYAALEAHQRGKRL